METTLLNSSLYQQLSEIQELTRKMSFPWMTAVENVSKSLQTFNTDALSEAMRAYSSLTELYRIPDYFDSSASLRKDYEDGYVNEGNNSEDVVTRDDVEVVVSYNTNVEDINKTNERFMKSLELQSKDFIRMLVWTDFEDGMENEVTNLVASYMEKNRYVTYCWLNKLFNTNRTRPNITSGLLRTLAMVVNKNDAGIMLSMVTTGLSSLHSEDQEAAIMVVEKWRTKECLEAMCNTTYGSDWVKEYAMQVIEELKNELEL